MKTPLAQLVLLVFCMVIGFSASAGAATNATYYAVYCGQNGSKPSISGGNHAQLGCSGSSNPNIETTVNSLTSDPQGAHDVTIVEADCYPDSASGSIQDGHIQCTNGPPATLTLGKSFKASKKATAGKGKKGGSKKQPQKPTSVKTVLSPIQSQGLPTTSATTSTIKTILKIVFGIIGAFALLNVVASGLKYITSGGDPGKTGEAKKGIIFALVGLAIAVSAEAIVAYVIKNGAPG